MADCGTRAWNHTAEKRPCMHCKGDTRSCVEHCQLFFDERCDLYSLELLKICHTTLLPCCLVRNPRASSRLCNVPGCLPMSVLPFDTCRPVGSLSSSPLPAADASRPRATNRSGGCDPLTENAQTESSLFN